MVTSLVTIALVINSLAVGIEFDLFEGVARKLDTAVWEAQTAKSVLLVVSRPGANEKSHRMSEFRLKVIRAYYETTSREPTEIYYVIGAPSRSLPAIEFFVSGRSLEVRGTSQSIIAPKTGFVNPWAESDEGYYILQPNNFRGYLRILTKRKKISLQSTAQQPHAPDRPFES